MYEYDLGVFNSDRRYVEHAQTIDFQHDEEVPESGNSIFGAVAIPATDVDPDRENSWIDEIENEKLLQGISQLKDDEIKILTMLVYEGKTMSETAEYLGVTQPAISCRFATIKKKLKKFF